MNKIVSKRFMSTRLLLLLVKRMFDFNVPQENKHVVKNIRYG